jgi:hypothetical protein
MANSSWKFEISGETFLSHERRDCRVGRCGDLFAMTVVGEGGEEYANDEGDSSSFTKRTPQNDNSSDFVCG